MRVIHFEILSDEPEKLSSFYTDLFNWQVHRWDGPQAYWPVSTGDKRQPGIDGGFMQQHLKQPVINTIDVEDVEAMTNRVKELGGQVVFGPHEVPGVGRHVYCSDPTGVIFGMIQHSKKED